jgi:hypothetical protein
MRAFIFILAMIFSEPIQFSEALQSREVRNILPTDLSSEQLSKIEPAILERALFSAQVTNAEYLQKIADIVEKLVNGEIDFATARLEAKDMLAELGYEAAPAAQGTMQDFASDVRINLVLETNTAMAQGYGTWLQGQAPSILDQWPAQELYRAFHRKVPRNWILRWRDAGGQFFGGRMIALKNAGIWANISRFRNPYPPFDFNSGMWTRHVDRDAAMKFGLIDRDTLIAPRDRGFNDDLQFTPAVRASALRQVLEEEGHSFNGDILTL